MLKSENLENLWLVINGESLTHLRFADDIALISDRLDHDMNILKQRNFASHKVRIQMNVTKTQLYRSAIQV